MAKKRVVKSKKVIEVEQFIPDNVINAITNVDPSFNSGKLLEAIIHYWGGVDKFAFSIVQEYKSTKPGTLVRQRIFEMINRLTMNVSQHTPPSKNAEEMETEELEAAVVAAVKSVDAKEKKRHAQEAETAAAEVRELGGLAAAVGQPGVEPKKQPRRQSRKKAQAADGDPG